MNRMLDIRSEPSFPDEIAPLGLDHVRWKTWKVFTLVAAIHFLAAVVYQEVVWTDDVYRAVFATRTDPFRFDEAVALARRLSVIGYLTLPLFLWVRIAACSLLVQFGFLLLWEEMPFHRLFRVLTTASLTGTAMLGVRAFMFSIAPPYEVTPSALMVPVFSLAGIVGIESYSPAARVVLENANLFELAWMILVWKGICKRSTVNRSDVAFVVLAVWCALVALQVALAFFFGGGLL